MIVLDVVIARLDVTAKPGWVVTALGRGEAHKISDILLLESEEDMEEREETLLFVKKWVSDSIFIYDFCMGLSLIFYFIFIFILLFLDFIATFISHYYSCYVIDVIIAIQIYAYLILKQLDEREKHFKSPESPKSIVQEILNYILISRKF